MLRASRPFFLFFLKMRETKSGPLRECLELLRKVERRGKILQQEIFYSGDRKVIERLATAKFNNFVRETLVNPENITSVAVELTEEGRSFLKNPARYMELKRKEIGREFKILRLSEK